VSTRFRIVVGLALVGVASVFMSGCEDTQITAPEGSTITLVAQPQSINIDQEAGDSRGDTRLVAQLLSSTGLPQSGVPLFFTASGGLLGSVNNQCLNEGSCADTGGACVVDSDCPVADSTAQETDSNGIATDFLTLRLSIDPESVEATAQSTVSSTTVMVGTNVNSGPTALITATPANGSRTGSPITFAAATQPGVLITCYQWQITSSKLGTNDETIYATTPTISKTYGRPFESTEDQDLALLLRVSGQQGVCGPGLPFSQSEDSISYQIRCDFTDPTLDAGPNVVRSLANDAQDGFVSVALRATAFDPDDACLYYTWDCDTSGTPPACNPDVELDCCGIGASVTCKYSTEGTFSPSVTVTNQCGRLVEDNLTVQINP